MTIKETILPNGLRVVAEINPQARSVAMGYFVRTGSRDEAAAEQGLSHFLEHMVFKGTDQRNGLQVNREFDQMGAQYNAMTSEEYTVYYGAVLPEFAPTLLELWTDLLRPSLTDQDFLTEQQVILEEIAQYLDRPQAMLFDWARQHYYQGHPLGHSVLGSEASIQALTPQAMRAYFARRYAPGNMVLALAGQVDWDRLLAQVGQQTAHWLPGSAERLFTPAQPNWGRQLHPYPRASQVYLALLAPGWSAQDERRYEASVLASILGDDSNSRLHWALVDSGLVESAGASHDEADGTGTYSVYLQTDPRYAAQARDLLLSQLQHLHQGVSHDEVQRAKARMATGLVFAAETPMSRLFNLGMGYLYQQRYQSLAEVAQRVQAITPQGVNALLEDRPFDPHLLYAVVPPGVEI